MIYHFTGKVQGEAESVSYAKSFNSDRGNKDLQGGEVINIMQDDEQHNGNFWFYGLVLEIYEN